MGRRITTVGAFASCKLPRSTTILAAHDNGPGKAASLVISYDENDAERVDRRFAMIAACAEPTPEGAQFVASFMRRGCGPDMQGVFCLFELPADEIPEAIPPAAHAHFRHLKREGFEYRCPAWYAPDGYGALAQDDIIALAELDPYGYGRIANA